MKRYQSSPRQADGALLAEPVRVAGKRLPKGKIIGNDEISLLEQAGINEIEIIRPNLTDVLENSVADTIAKAAAHSNTYHLLASLGHTSIVANKPGILNYDLDALNHFNREISEILIAALPNLQPVVAKMPVATVKTVPLAIERKRLEQAKKLVPKFVVQPFATKKVALVQTVTNKSRDDILAKTQHNCLIRLERFASDLIATETCQHTASAFAEKLTSLATADIIIAVGAYAANETTDPLPTGLIAAGGTIIRFGLPYEPGHLVVIGKINATTVLIVPGSFRSPKRGSYDLLLEWLHVGIEPTNDKLANLGAGGLHKTLLAPSNLPSNSADKKIGGILLAAGMSQRMGSINKLTANHAGQPLVRHAAKTLQLALKRGICHEAVVVCGHQAEQVSEAIDDLKLSIQVNDQFEQGMASSLQTGLAALSKDLDGIIVVLADMPEISLTDIKQLIANFDPTTNRTIVVSTHRNKRGNPVLIGARHFDELRRLQGDTGARALFAEHGVFEIEATAAVVHDVDLPEQLR